MKVFNKGQVVIPVDIRKLMNIHLGERLDVRVDQSRQCIELRKQEADVSTLAGSLSSFSAKRKFPDRKRMRHLLAKGLSGEKRTD